MLAKTALFPKTLASLAEQAKALSHPARLAIVEHLADRDTCICGELVDALPLAQATVSRHLKVLKDAGLVQGEIDGPRSCYCLDRDALERLQAAFETFFHGALNSLPEAACAPGATVDSGDGCC